MYIYIVRHCQANEAFIDNEKHLSPQGIEEAESIAGFLKPMNISVQHIFHSGKTRANETAEFLSTAVKSANGISKHTGINPDDPVEDVIAELLSYNQDILIVGHLPFVENLASYLLKGDDTKCGLNFSTGSVMCLKKNEFDNWKLEWMISPSLLNRK